MCICQDRLPRRKLAGKATSASHRCSGGEAGQREQEPSRADPSATPHPPLLSSLPAPQASAAAAHSLGAAETRSPYGLVSAGGSSLYACVLSPRFLCAGKGARGCSRGTAACGPFCEFFFFFFFFLIIHESRAERRRNTDGTAPPLPPPPFTRG